MKRLLWICGATVFAAAALWLIAQVQGPQSGPASLMPHGAVLYLEAKDFHSLLGDWDSSQAKRTWLAGDDYAAFSRSRLFQRLSQAQDEFSTAATIPADANLLGSVAGGQSALALYDIGNLQFVYVTRMEEPRAEATPLWLARDKFEQRTEGASRFYVRQNQQSDRIAVFAIDQGWLILGTRADLVAGVLDRLDGRDTHGMPDEPWYADAVKQVAAPPGELRMVLNLEKIVPSPYFRSYWVQRNIREMEQYRSALCDLHRTESEFRETRVLLRPAGAAPRSSGDVAPLMTLVPNNAVFAAAQASPSSDQVLTVLRENVLDLRSGHVQVQPGAPPPAVIENAGSASDLEERIDVAPVLAKEADEFAALRTLLHSANPNGVLQVYITQSSPQQMFVGLERGMVVQAAASWDDVAVRDAISATFRRGITASSLGIGWNTHTGPGGTIASLNGSIPLYLAIRGNRLYLATTEGLVSAMLAQRSASVTAQNQAVTYEADFQHSADEQQVFRKLAGRLDTGGHEAAAPDSPLADDPRDGSKPAFFSGNIASLSRMGQSMVRETVTEKDQGATVAQTVVYRWKQK
jgi:hypothetical protein